MEITKDKLQKRVASYESQKEQLVGQLNACNGALLEAKALLSEIDAPEPAPDADNQTAEEGPKKKAK